MTTLRFKKYLLELSQKLAEYMENNSNLFNKEIIYILKKEDRHSNEIIFIENPIEIKNILNICKARE